MCDQCSEYRNVKPGDVVFVEAGPWRPSGVGKVVSASSNCARIEINGGTYLVYNPWFHKSTTSARD